MINKLRKVHHLGFEIVEQTVYPLSTPADVTTGPPGASFNHSDTCFSMKPGVRRTSKGSWEVETALRPGSLKLICFDPRSTNTFMQSRWLQPTKIADGVRLDRRSTGSTSVPVAVRQKGLPVCSLTSILTSGPTGFAYRHQSKTSLISRGVRPDASRCSTPSDRISIKSIVILFYV